MYTTQEEIVARAQKNWPELRIAVSASGGAIGAWDYGKERFVMVVGKTIIPGPNGEENWIECPVEILIDGKPPVTDWIEVTANPAQSVASTAQAVTP